MKKKIYIRDGRAPIPEKESTSRVMSANKDRNTKPELYLRKTLWKNNLKGYRLHWKKVPGSPDITFPGKKVAIFVNGCYWHRCPHCKLSLPKSNTVFWEEKFRKNVERDKRKIENLENLNWATITVWECQIKTDIDKSVEKIKKLWLEN